MQYLLPHLVTEPITNRKLTLLTARERGMFFNMDQMIGKDFEVGLAKLKAVAEK